MMRSYSRRTELCDVALGGGILALLTLYGCSGGGPPKIPPPHPCETALVCANVDSRSEASCRFVFNDRVNTTLFNMQNNSAGKAIRVKYEEKVRHINSTSADEKVTKTVTVQPRQSETLGCERTKGFLSNQFDEWSYTKLDACYVGDACPGVPEEKPTKERDPRRTCEDLCLQEDASCLKAQISGGGALGGKLRAELTQFSNALAGANPPTDISLKALADISNIYTGGTACTRGDLHLDASSGTVYPFAASGTSCPVGLEVQDLRISSVELTMPGIWSGEMQKTAQGYGLASGDKPHSPMLEIVELGTSKRVFEPVVKVTGGPRRLTLTGEKYYCAEVSWSGD